MVIYNRLYIYYELMYKSKVDNGIMTENMGGGLGPTQLSVSNLKQKNQRKLDFVSGTKTKQKHQVP